MYFFIAIFCPPPFPKKQIRKKPVHFSANYIFFKHIINETPHQSSSYTLIERNNRKSQQIKKRWLNFFDINGHKRRNQKRTKELSGADDNNWRTEAPEAQHQGRRGKGVNEKNEKSHIYIYILLGECRSYLLLPDLQPGHSWHTCSCFFN